MSKSSSNNRLSHIVTRTGDDGSTGLGDGSRIPKDSSRITALGAVDELNCALGVLLCSPLPAELVDWLSEVQHDLFDLGSELAVPGYSALQAEQIQNLEGQLAFMNEELPALKEFILPGGCLAAAQAQQARAICRRAERDLVHLAQQENVSEASRHYLNRLSDWLFVLARYLNAHFQVADVLWQPRRLSTS